MAMSVDDANDNFPENSKIVLLTSTCKVVKTENTSQNIARLKIDICRKTTFSKKSLTGPGFSLCLKYREPAYF